MKTSRLDLGQGISTTTLYKIMLVVDKIGPALLILTLLYWITGFPSDGDVETYVTWRLIPPGILLLVLLVIKFYKIPAVKESEILSRINNISKKRISNAQKGGTLTITDTIDADSNGDSLIIDDKAKEMWIYQLKMDLFTGIYYLLEMIIPYKEIKEISVQAKPEELDIKLDESRNYTMGGLLIGGVGGMLPGAIVDGIINFIRSPKRVNFRLSIRFTLLEQEKQVITFEPTRTAFGLTSENVSEFREFAKSIVVKNEHCLKIINKYFKDKIR